MNSIAITRQSIQEEISRLYSALKVLQSECKHSNLEVKYGANTGNYDPSSDCYWKDFSCPDCGKQWTVYDYD